MVSGGLALSAESKVESDTPIHAHYPVKLRVGGSLNKIWGKELGDPRHSRDLPENNHEIEVSRKVILFIKRETWMNSGSTGMSLLRIILVKLKTSL
eukprot:377034-Heterocapsa_arctica.AAC.1